MRFSPKTLGGKVLCLTSLLTTLAFAGLFLANSYWQKQATLKDAKAGAKLTSQLLEIAVADPMRLGDNEGTAKIFAKLAEGNKDVQVYLTDFKGNITYSTAIQSLRKDLTSIRQGQLSDTLSGILKNGGETSYLTLEGGMPSFVEVQAINNNKECWHCHGKSQPILGAMVVFQDVSGPFATLKDSQVNGAIISISGLALLLGALIFFMKGSVVDKVRTIAAVASEVSRGNLDAEFVVKGTDELADLSRHLSSMVNQIKDQLEYNRSVLAGIIVPILVTDLDGRINFANKPLCDILGCLESELMGQEVALALTGIHGSGHTTQLIRDGNTRSGNTSIKHKDGRNIPVHFEMSPLLNSHGVTVGAIEVLIDLTQEEADRKAIEENRNSLLSVAVEVTTMSTNLSEAAETLHAQMVGLEKNVDSSADQTTQVATAMEEMNATVLEVAKNASATSEASDKANQVARHGGVMVQNTVGEIQAVANITEKLAATLNDLSHRAEKIGDVLAVITDIADQTNLLALNAAIEAARAGDAGRGFAVVADEVRKLAEKTMGATKEVEDVIRLVQQGTAEAVQEMGGAQERIIKTATMASEAGKVLSQIVTQSDGIADMMRSIATAAEEQSATSDEININVARISEISRQIFEDIKTSNQRISNVSDMSQSLSGLVARFNA